MQVVINRKELIDRLPVLEMALPGKVSFTLIEGIYMSREGDSLTLCANDLEMAIRLSMRDVRGSGDGTTVLPKKFVQIAKQLPGDEISITVENDRAEIVSGSSKFKLNCIDAEEFPTLDDSYTERPFFEVNGQALKEMIRKVAFCVSTDSSRPMFGCVYISNDSGVLSCIASDTYRLSWYKNLKIDYAEPFEILVPGALLTKVGKIVNDDDNVRVHIDSSELVFVTDDYVVSARLIDGKYPDLKKALPKNPETQIVINKQALSDAINRARLVIGKQHDAVTLSIADDFTIKAQSEIGKMSEELPMQAKGKPLERLLINAKYLLEGVKAVDGDDLYADFHGEDGAVIVKAAGFRYLALPIKAN
jgi:DNA polymerase-3 subunit beta